MKVMIVEDDTLVRMGIKSLVPWAEMGLEVVCEACDVDEAEVMFAQNAPDLALVDIGLPKGSGLDFIAHAKSVNPDAEFIILTCNKEFELVRQSLRLGVRDYVMKSTMEIDELTGVIRNTADKIRMRKVAAGSDKTLVGMKQQAFLQDWLNGVYQSNESIAVRGSELGLQPERFSSYEAWVIRIDGRLRQGEELHPADLDKLGYAIGNMAQELYKSFWIGMVAELKERRWHTLVGVSANAANPDLLVNAVRDYLGCEISIGISEGFRMLAQWYEQDQAALGALTRKYYSDDASVFHAGTALLPALPESVHRLKTEFVKQITLLRFDEALAALDLVLEELHHNQPSYPHPEVVRHLFKELHRELNAVYAGLNLISASFGSVSKEQVDDTLSDNVRQLREQVIALRQVFYDNRRVSDRKRIVKAVEAYIRANVMKEISLGAVAEELNLSAPYLSRLFKEETGSSFTDYVVQMKAEQATTMMNNGVTATEVADLLGYMNLSSFSRMYKKYYGQAPTHLNKRFKEK